MTDVHCHILYGIDDGSHSLEESIELLKALKSIGFDKVILTPHYIEGSEYNADNDIKIEKIKKLKARIQEEKIGIEIYLGNEIFIHNDLIKSFEDDKIYTLNNTRYFLLELPFHNQILNLEDIIHEVKISGLIPVIAHPERYDYFQDNYQLVDELHEMGVLFQCNYQSILGYYREDAEKLFKYMLKKHYVSFLGTDLHHLDRPFVIENFDKIKKHIIKITGKEYYEEIMNNCNKLVKE